MGHDLGAPQFESSTKLGLGGIYNMTTACVLVANGFEETEAVAVIDVLRRAEIQTRVLGVEGIDPVGSHDIRLRADALFSDEVNQSWDAIILPEECLDLLPCAIAKPFNRRSAASSKEANL